MIALALLAVPSLARADETIVTVDRATPISAYGGRLAWSRYDAATKTFRLVTRVNGQTSDAPIAPRNVAFDVDLGPDAARNTAAVYSRCKTDPPQPDTADALYGHGKGCDLYRFDFATGHESAITSANAPDASEFWPTIWKGTLAFARTYDNKPQYPYIYTRPASGGGTSTRQPGGPRNACQTNRNTGRTSCSSDRLSRPSALELYGKRLGFAWTYLGFGEGLDTEIRMDTIGDGHTRVARQAGGGLTQVELGWPAFADGQLYWSVGCFGDPGGCPGRFGLRRYRISTGAAQSAAGPASVISHERDGATTYLLDDRQVFCAGDPPVAGGTCDLTSSQPAFS